MFECRFHKNQLTQDSIQDFIAFPKNNSGRDVMLDTPAPISGQQLNELKLIVERGK